MFVIDEESGFQCNEDEVRIANLPTATSRVFVCVRVCVCVLDIFKIELRERETKR